LLREPWVVRVEDIDAARSTKAHWDLQKKDLAVLGLIADQIVIQSEHHQLHRERFDAALKEGRIYACDCSRKEVNEGLSQLVRAPHELPPDYTGHCRNRPATDIFKPADTLAWRWRAKDESGRDDAIVARSDVFGDRFVPGYHWACAIDDAEGRYSTLVRAWDLAGVEKVQREIREWSGASNVQVFHTALVVREDGGRLEKRTQGVTLDEVLAAGKSVEDLLAAFAQSFDEASVHANRPLGETSREISVVTLLA
jgi:glutamyl/glutaminyl-tRNA synthetase